MVDNEEYSDKEQEVYRSTSHLFLLRLWEDDAPTTPQAPDNSVPLAAPGGDNGNETTTKEFHGKIQHVLSGEVQSFNSLAALVSALAAMLPPGSQSTLPGLGTLAENV